MKFSGLGYLIKEGLKNVWHNRIMSIASVCVLMSCMVLTGAAVLFSTNVALVVDSVSGNNETTFYLKDGLSGAETKQIGKSIEKTANISSVKFYSKDEAFKRYKKELGETVFDLLNDDNPLPDAYIVKMKDLSGYDATVKKVLAIKGVDSAFSRQETAEKLTRIDNLVQNLSIWILIALGVISLFIISNTIRATMYSRRFEISIMKSVGATNHFVRFPFVIEGMTLGLIAAVFSTVIMFFLYDGIMGIVTGVLPYTAKYIINFADVVLYVGGAYAAAGVLIGAVSGVISIRKYLKKEGNELLGW